jgi:fucose permease
LEKGHKQTAAAAVFCTIIMLITAASDALRGVFLPQFERSFSLDKAQSSLIITVSYIGNLLFLFIGGYLSDRLPRKKFLGCVLGMWCLALTAYVFTESYSVLLCGMIFSMGGSTMISTSVNLVTPLLFMSPALMVNLFNFSQGVGITLTQNIGGRFAESISAWHVINGILLGLALVCAVLLIFLRLPDPEKPKRSVIASYKQILRSPASILLILVTGCYFIAEHGLQNWLVSYGSQHLGFSVGDSAFYLSLFFGGITVGRLIFAPLVQKLGIARSMVIFSSLAAVLYAVGILMRGNGMYVIAASGLAFSVLYPTLVLLIAGHFDTSLAGAATGFILSLATIFDIAFNALFGTLVKNSGYSSPILLLPAAMILFAAGLWLKPVRTLNDSKG